MIWIDRFWLVVYCIWYAIRPPRIMYINYFDGEAGIYLEPRPKLPIRLRERES